MNVPLTLAYRPQVGGLVVPWINIRLADGGVDFRGTHQTKWLRCWKEGLCQTCGEQLHGTIVFFGGPNQLSTYFTEPPLHPECAAYARQACPMVAGRMATYAKNETPSRTERGAVCPDPGCDCGGWVPIDGATHHGEPAHDWYALWATGWVLAGTADGKLLGGVPSGEISRRLISSPPAGQAS